MSWIIVGVNLFYAIAGMALALLALHVAYRLIDRLTPFRTGAELQAGNQAVGLVVAGSFVAVGLAVGLVVGLSLN